MRRRVYMIDESIIESNTRSHCVYTHPLSHLECMRSCKPDHLSPPWYSHSKP